MEDWQKYKGGIYHVRWSENWHKWLITNGVCMTGQLWDTEEQAQKQCDEINEQNLLKADVGEQLSLFD